MAATDDHGRDGDREDRLVAFARRLFGDRVIGRERAATLVREADSTTRRGVDRLLAALSDAEESPAVRRTAAETLFAVADAAPGTVPAFAPELAAGLDDEATRFAVAGVLRRFDPGERAVAAALRADDAGTRGAATEYCERRARTDDGAAGSGDPVHAGRLLDPLRAALADDDVRVRRTAAATLRWSTRDQHARDLPAVAVPALLAAAGDDDPDVRRHATVAAAMVALARGVTDAERAVEAAERVGEALGDPDPGVRRDVAVALLPDEDAGHEVAGYPEAAVGPLVLGIVRATTDGPVPERARSVPTYVAACHADLLSDVAGELLALGWEADPPSELARETVAAMVESGTYLEAAPEAVAVHASRLVAAVDRGVGVESAVETLLTLSETEAGPTADRDRERDRGRDRESAGTAADAGSSPSSAAPLAGARESLASLAAAATAPTVPRRGPGNRCRSILIRSRRNTAGVDGVAALDVRPGEYELVPSESLRGATAALQSMLSVGTGETSELLLHEIERTDGPGALEVVVRAPEPSDGVTIRSSSRDLLFRPPDGDPAMALEIDGPITAYTLRDLTTGDVLATWRQSLYVLGSWQVDDADGTHRATLRRARSLRSLLSRYRTYVLRTVDGTEAGRFEEFPIERSLLGGDVSGVTVTIASSSLPPEVVLGVAYGAFREARGSGSNTGGGGVD